MKPMGIIIFLVILVFVAVEIWSLIRAIKDNMRFKKGVNKDGSSCDDRNRDSSSDH